MDKGSWRLLDPTVLLLLGSALVALGAIAVWVGARNANPESGDQK